MADTGFIICGTGANGDAGDANWSNPTNIQVDDSSDASVSMPKNDTSAYLRATNFSFGAISGYYLRGIEVEINFTSMTNYNSEDLYLRTTAGRTGVDKGGTPAVGVRTYGGPTDLWGTAYTMSDIVGSDFGIDYRCGRNGTAATNSLNIDYVKIKVYYSEFPTYSIQNNNDDGYEEQLNWYATPTPAGYMWAGEYYGYPAHMGFRFDNLVIPKGAQIDSAVISICRTVNDIQSAITGGWYAWDHDDAPIFVNGGNEPNNVTKTTAYVAQNYSPGGVQYIDTTITSIVQEIKDRPGWATGQAINFIWFSTTTSGSNDYLSFNDYYENANLAARLYIEYTIYGNIVNGVISLGKVNEVPAANISTVNGI